MRAYGSRCLVRFSHKIVLYDARGIEEITTVVYLTGNHSYGFQHRWLCVFRDLVYNGSFGSVRWGISGKSSTSCYVMI